MADVASRRAGTGVVTELRARGYAVLPAPRQVELRPGTVDLDASWRLEADGVGGDDISARVLRTRLREEHGLALGDGADGGGTVRLCVREGAVQTGTGDDRDEQAYRLTVAPGRVEVIGNAPAGLFYGVQTLVQLLDGDGRRPPEGPPGSLAVRLPEGTIADWPQYQLRFVHWDTKHHQDRIETLKRYLDWMARFKLNMVSFELEDKFEYPSHPVIGAPGAFTTDQMQELVRYGLERHVEIVPNVQAPAHLCYVLKHQEFAHLRCDGSNYQICMDEPEARRLLFDMYGDLCRATEGVKHFHVSTDEVYYAGICEKHRRPYNPQNRSLTWVDYVQAAHEHLTARGRRVLVWAEYPLLPEHAKLLPADIIDGIGGPTKAHDLAVAVRRHGMRELVYCSMQGEERLFPNHFAYVDRDGVRKPGRLADAYAATLLRTWGTGADSPPARPIGTFAAAWDDSGLHNETFWLGWAMMAQGSWTPGAAAVEQTVADFMDIYHGRTCVDMVEVYRDMQDQARFWEHAWDRRPSKVRGPVYGNHREKRPVALRDMTLLPPAMPKLPDLSVQPVYRVQYAKLLAELPQRLRDNDRLLARLHANLSRAQRNRHSLEVFLSLAYLVRRFIEAAQGVAEAEDLLVQAFEAQEKADPSQAVALTAKAHAGVGRILDVVEASYRDLVAVWDKSRYPRNAPVGAKEFVHVMDDVKDHFADRRADLSYHTAPFESIGLDQWRDELAEVISSYAAMHGIEADLS